MGELLRPIADEVWETEQVFKLGPVRLDHRMTVVRLEGGGLWIHSPVRLDPDLRAALDALGRVEHVIAPSLFHDLHLQECSAAYPDARLYCAPGFSEEHPDLTFHKTLGDDPPDVWSGKIDQHLIAGMPRVNEIVFLHRASRTLIVADLLFNLGRDVDLISGFCFRLFGTYGCTASSRLYRSFIKDRAAFRSSLDRILSQEFDRVVVGHGSIVEIGGRQVLEQAYSSL